MPIFPFIYPFLPAFVGVHVSSSCAFSCDRRCIVMLFRSTYPSCPYLVTLSKYCALVILQCVDIEHSTSCIGQHEIDWQEKTPEWQKHFFWCALFFLNQFCALPYAGCRTSWPHSWLFCRTFDQTVSYAGKHCPNVWFLVCDRSTMAS